MPAQCEVNTDLLDLCATARTLDRAARANLQEWPLAAREFAALCVGLEHNAAAVLSLVKSQATTIAALSERVEHLEGEQAILAGKLAAAGAS